MFCICLIRSARRKSVNVFAPSPPWEHLFPAEPIRNLGGESCKSVMAKRLCSQLFVSRLSFYTTEQGLKKLFSPFGTVKEARLVRDPRSGRPKGFGFISFDSEAQAQKALSGLNGRIVDGRLIFVEFVKNSEGEKQKDQK